MEKHYQEFEKSEKAKTALFVLFTPYQIVSALNTMENQKLVNVDFLYATENILKYRTLAEKYVRTNIIIKELITPNVSPISVSKKIKLAHQLIKKKYFLRKHRGDIKKYDLIFVPSADVNCRLVFHYASKEAKLCLIDDGVGTYVPGLFKKKTFLGETVFTIFLDRNYRDHFTHVFCYNPELLPNEAKGIECTKLVMCDSATNFLRDIGRDVYKKYSNKKVIVLDQGKIGEKVLLKFLEMARGKYNSDDIIIKKHPRIKDHVDYGDIEIDDSGVPFESIVAFIPHGTIIVAHSSTACLTAYSMLGNNNKIIVLLGIDDSDTDTFKYFIKIKEINAKGIFLPRTVEELEQIL